METSLDGGPAVEIVDREEAPPSAELLEEQTSIEARIEALEAGSEQPGDDEEGELDRLYARLDEIAAMPGEFSPETMARTGVFLSIDLEGSVDSECGLIRREDRPTMPAVSGGGAQATPGLDNDAVRLLDQAEQIATKSGDAYVTVERLLLALTLATTTDAGQALKAANLDATALEAAVTQLRGGRKADSAEEAPHEE